MKIVVVGLWHLGTVTAACLAQGKHSVIAYDADTAIIASLQNNHAPLFEPGLNELLANGQQARLLHFSSSLHDLTDAEIVWITLDTPVDENDIADVDYVITQIKAILPFLNKNTLVLISSQVPVGTTRRLLNDCINTYPEKNISFAYSPENLRLGKAITVFTQPDRVIVGLQTEQDKNRIQNLLKPFTDNIVWMSIESAEMTKHALNAFLATSVVFINEIATICEQVGANASEVELGLKTEERIGKKAYLRPGGPIAGGTLARDVNYLVQISEQHNVNTPLFSSLLTSNQFHKQWSCRRITEVVKNLQEKTIVALGLTYKPGTDTLRRSSAVETCAWLHAQGARVVAYDPVIKQLPENLRWIELKTTLDEALQGAEAVIVATEWPQFTALTANQLVAAVKKPLVFDASGFLVKMLGADERVEYYSVGKNGMKLSGRFALITGASQGLGFEIAKQFLLEGANILICARDPVALEQARHTLTDIGKGSVLAMPADVSDLAQMQHVVETALKTWGKIDILVANAGIYGTKGPIDEVDWEEWSRAIDINLKGTVIQCRTVLPHFKKQRGGKIIIMSGGGATKAMPNLSAYAASKAAVVRFAETLAEEVKSFHVDVNTVAPGALNTRLLDEVLAAGPDKVGSEFYAQSLKQKQSGGTSLTVGAELCVFLGSPASDGITGRLISAVWDPWAKLPDLREQLDTSDIYTLRRIVPKDRGQDWGDG